MTAVEEAAGTLGVSPLLRVAADPTAGRTVLETARRASDVPVVRTGPTGVEAYEPLLLATVAGRTALYPAPGRPAVEDVADGAAAGDLPTDEAVAVVEHDPGTRVLPTPGHGPLGVGRRDVLGPCGWVDPLSPADHEFVSTGAGDATDALDGLLGRGRGDAAAGEPVTDTWATVRESAGEPVVVLNANDTDPRQRADRTLLAGAPLAVLDGVAAVAERVGAADAVLYVNEAETDLQRHLQAAVDAVADRLPVVPQLVAGPDEYRAGAPTAALEALEGNDRIEPRLQPPSPAEQGLYGRPTAIHSVRTVLQVRRLLQQGSRQGVDAAPGPTRLFTVTGDAAPATAELGPENRLSALVEAVDLDGFEVAVVGGVLGGITDDLDAAPTHGALTAAGLGTEGAVELFADRCPVALAGERARFASEANSGRCVPGREGTVQLTDLLRAVYDGSYDPGAIRELGRVMERTSNCRIGARAPRPALTAMDRFGGEFEAHAGGRCPRDCCDI